MRQQNCPLHSCVGFVSSLACLNRSTTGFMRPKVQVYFHREQELCFVLWLDCMADSGQLSCTCHWSSVPKGQFLLSITTARKHLKVHASLWMGWPHLLLLPSTLTHTQESTLLLIYRVTASEKVVLVSSPSVPIHCVWFYVAHGETVTTSIAKKPELRGQSCCFFFCRVAHLYLALPSTKLLCLFALVLLIKILSRE